MKPQEAFQLAVQRGLFWRYYRSPGRTHWDEHQLPGAVIKRMSPEAREALCDLKAEHTQDRQD